MNRITDPGCAAQSTNGMIDAWLVPRHREAATLKNVHRGAGTTGIVMFAPAGRTNLASPSNAVVSCT
jgi:hypothetical protein